MGTSVTRGKMILSRRNRADLLRECEWYCCGGPGRGRYARTMRRVVKRRERQAWKREEW